jgi:catalase
LPDRPVLTSNFGQPVADDQDSVTAGARGLVLASMKAVTRREIVERQLGHFVRVDARLAAGIAQRLEVSA